jgi:hypothetical protein
VGSKYTVELRDDTTIPRWTWGTAENLKGPYGLPALGIEVEEGGIGTLFLQIRHSIKPVFIISTSVANYTASIGKLLDLRAASKNRSGAGVVDDDDAKQSILSSTLTCREQSTVPFKPTAR